MSLPTVKLELDPMELGVLTGLLVREDPKDYQAIKTVIDSLKTKLFDAAQSFYPPERQWRTIHSPDLED